MGSLERHDADATAGEKPLDAVRGRMSEAVGHVRELFLGAVIGLGAGLTPGPLLGLVLPNTLKKGFGAGLRVAMSPLLSNVIILPLVLFVVGYDLIYDP